MRSSRAALVGLAVVAALACRDRDGARPARATASSTPVAGGTLRLSAPGGLSTLDPALAYDEISAWCLHHLHDTLVGYPAAGTTAERLTLVPRLASSWSVSPDGLTYRFELRPQLRFADGTPLTADDFVRAWRRVLRTPVSPFPPFLDPVDGAGAYARGERDELPGLRVDGGALEVRLTRPDAAFLYVLAMPFTAPLPASAHGATEAALRRGVPGTGPFVVASWREGEVLTLARNPHYWDAPRPYLDGVEFRENVPRDTAFLAFQRGELDVVDRLASPDWRALSRQPGSAQLHVEPQLSTFGARMDVRRPPFDDVRVRRALNHAVDRAAQIKILDGLAVPAHGMLPPSVLGRDDSLSPYAHDPGQARALLAEAGYGAGFDVEYVTVQEVTAERLAQVLVADLAKVGVRVRLTVLAFPAYLEAIAAPAPPAFSYTSWLIDYPDPSNFLDARFHSRFIGASNDQGYANPEVDRLLDRARATADPAARAADYRQVERLLHDDAPWIWGYHPQIAVVVQPDVRAVAPHPVWVHDFSGAWIDREPRR